MSGQATVLQVVILRDGLLVGTEVFLPGAYHVGSGSGADLRLDDPSIHPQHATLYFQNGRAAIHDSGSPSGVYVNGHRVKTCEIRPVDEVVCGPFTLKLRVIAQKGASAPPPEVAAALRGGPSPRPARPGLVAPAPAGHGHSPTVVQPAPRPANAPVAATAISARRLAAVPQTPSAVASAATAPAAKPTPHLRAVTPLPAELEVDDSMLEPDEETTAIAARPGASLDVPTQRVLPDGRARPEAIPTLSRADAVERRPRLFLELYWGDFRQEARTFDRKSALPLFGFSVPEDFVLAEETESGYCVFLPANAQVEQRVDGRFAPIAPQAVLASGDRRFVELKNGAAVRISEGEMSLIAYVQPALRRPFANPLRGTPWLALFFLALFGGALGAFLYVSPKAPETADFQRKDLPPVAVRLIAPEPKKKEAARKKLEALKEAAAKKSSREKPSARSREKNAVAAAPEAKALKALAKLTSSGPATNNILAAVDKLGNGPGAKNAKGPFKLAGLIGKGAPNPGLGTFGLGGGGRGGSGTKGAELLRGTGGLGIGALGAGNIGRRSVGGTVTRATARSVAVQGSIDREAVAKTVNAHIHEVSACYERELLRDPGLAGKVVLEWTISVQGKVISAKTKSSTLRNAAVEGCILRSLKGWTFPRARGGMVIVSYPFLFNSVGY